jgi:putative sterol carrier protein/putative NADPH-quinone reductase
MIKLPSTKENLSRFFTYIVDIYNKNQTPDIKAVYQFNFEENKETFHFYLTITNGKATYKEGIHDNPDIVIDTPVSIWLDVASGKLSGIRGYLTKKYHVEGPVHLLKKFSQITSDVEFTEKEIPGVNDKIKDYEKPEKRAWKKPEKILIFNGSPRRKNGFTYFYLKYLIEGIKKSGVDVEVINIYDKNLNIEPCRGCFNCWTKTNGNCVIHDDANKLIEKWNKAYLTIYAFPLYVDSIPGKLKSLLDRKFITLRQVFVPYKNLTRHPLREVQERYIALFSISGFPEIEHFKPLVETFSDIARNCHRPLLSVILRPGAQSLYENPLHFDDLKKVLDSLEKAGRQLVEKGKVSQNVLRWISNDYEKNKKQWRTFTNFYWYRRGKNTWKQLRQ